MRHLIALLACLGGASASFSFSNTMGDHMVLQQAPLRAKVWGFANVPGEVITVGLYLSSPRVSQQLHQAIAEDIPGVGIVWSVLLNPVSGVFSLITPYIVTATLGGVSPQPTIFLNDVLFGDVYVCSGQSNMEWTVIMSEGGTTAGGMPIPHFSSGVPIRLFRPMRTKSAAEQHQQTLPALMNWTRAEDPGALGVATAETDKHKLLDNGFSAVCYHYAVSLAAKRRPTDMTPIGLIAVAYAGTHIALWSPQGVFEDVCADYVNPLIKQGLKISLPGKDIRGKVGDWLQASDVDPGEKNLLWNGMIAPLLRTTIKGVLWYQGESDAYNGNENFYPCWFPAMIARWRSRWAADSGSDPEFPWLVVQLAPWGDTGRLCDGDSDCLAAPLIRYGQTANLGKMPNSEMPNAFMVTALDLGDVRANDTLHPKYKKQVGERLASSAMRNIYNSPAFADETYPTPLHAKSDGDLVITFQDVPPGGLVVHNDTGGFEAYMGCSWQYVHSATTVSGNTVQLAASALGGTPTSVRYNWFRAPCNIHPGLYGCTLYQASANLPVLPFSISVEHGDLTLEDQLNCALEKAKENAILLAAVLIAAAVFICLVTVCVCCICRRRRNAACCSDSATRKVAVKPDENHDGV